MSEKREVPDMISKDVSTAGDQAVLASLGRKDLLPVGFTKLFCRLS